MRTKYYIEKKETKLTENVGWLMGIIGLSFFFFFNAATPNFISFVNIIAGLFTWVWGFIFAVNHPLTETKIIKIPVHKEEIK